MPDNQATGGLGVGGCKAVQMGPRPRLFVAATDGAGCCHQSSRATHGHRETISFCFETEVVGREAGRARWAREGSEGSSDQRERRSSVVKDGRVVVRRRFSGHRWVKWKKGLLTMGTMRMDPYLLPCRSWLGDDVHGRGAEP